MSIYIPFSGATGSFVANLNQVKSAINLESENIIRYVNDNKSTLSLPTVLDDLDKETIEIIDLSVDAALALKIPFGSVDNKLARRVFIQEYKKYKVIEHENEILHYGISIRWIVNIKKYNASADISSLPMVTASAQFNNLSASVRFEVVGLTSPQITELLPSSVDLNSDTYVDLKNAFESIKKLIWDENTHVIPCVLGVFGDVKSDDDKILLDAVAISYALKKIENGKTLQKAISDISGQTGTIEIVKTVYEEITKSSELTKAPSTAARNKAKQILNDLL